MSAYSSCCCSGVDKTWFSTGRLFDWFTVKNCLQNYFLNIFLSSQWPTIAKIDKIRYLPILIFTHFALLNTRTWMRADTHRQWRAAGERGTEDTDARRHRRTSLHETGTRLASTQQEIHSTFAHSARSKMDIASRYTLRPCHTLHRAAEPNERPAKRQNRRAPRGTPSPDCVCRHAINERGDRLLDKLQRDKFFRVQLRQELRFFIPDLWQDAHTRTSRR